MLAYHYGNVTAFIELVSALNIKSLTLCFSHSIFYPSKSALFSSEFFNACCNARPYCIPCQGSKSSISTNSCHCFWDEHAEYCPSCVPRPGVLDHSYTSAVSIKSNRYQNPFTASRTRHFCSQYNNYSCSFSFFWPRTPARSFSNSFPSSSGHIYTSAYCSFQ